MIAQPGVQKRWYLRLPRGNLVGFGAAVAGVAVVTGLIDVLPPAQRVSNISMLYLLVVIGVALRFGSGPALLASILAFLAFDWFFVEPHHIFTVRDPDEWLALIMFLITASVTGQLTAANRGLLAHEQAARAQAEAARERLSAILQSMGEAFVMMDKEGRFSYFNRAAERLFAEIAQKTQQELIGKALWEVFPEAVGTRFAAEYHRAVAEHTTFEFEEFSAPLATWLEVRAHPHEEGLSVFFRSITARKQTEEQLRARERQQAAVALLGQQGLSGIDPAPLMEQAAALVAETLQVEYAKILELLPEGNALLLRAGVGWKEGYVGYARVDTGAGSQASYTLHRRTPIIVEDLQAETRFNVPPLLHDHRAVSGMSVAIAGQERPFGTLGAYSARRRTFSQDDGHFLQAIANVIAMAVERKRTEEEIKQRERETAALAQASWAVASQVSRDKALAEVLRRLSDVLDPEAAAILVPGDRQLPEVVACGEGEAEQLSAVTRGLAASAIEFVLESGQPIVWEGDGHPSAAAPCAIEPGAAYLPITMDQQVLGVLYVKLRRDQTRLKHQRTIESLANHAAVVLERDRLTRSETQARVLAEADRLKTALLSMVSHDFRSPLASIKASVAGLLQRGTTVDAAMQRELLLGVNQATDRLNRMVGNILALSRLEADAWRPQREPTPIAEVIGAALDAFSAEDNRRIQVVLDPALTEAWLDSVQMVQALYNLVDNALKYSSPPGMVDLKVFPRDDRLVMEVLDRGPGLPEADEELIFDRFYRAPALQESSVPGVGIGLAVCHGLVEAHGGRLTAENRAGGGAVFRITLPLRQCEQAAARNVGTR